MFIENITPIDIEKFLKSILTTYNFGERSLTNVMGYLRSNMAYACKKKLLNSNPCPLVELAPIIGFCKKNRKKDSERILSNEDMAKLIATPYQKQSEDDLYVKITPLNLRLCVGCELAN